MHERTFVRSGGREPAVVRESHWQPRLRSTRAVAGAASAVFRATAAAPLRMGFRKPRGLTPRSCFRAGMCVVMSSAFRLSNHGGLRPPLLYVATSTFAGGIATFAMHKRTFVKSGGREPAVVRESHRQPRLRRCAHAVFAAHTVVARRIRSGGRQPAVLRESHRQPRLRRCSRAVFTAHAVVGRRIRSGGREPAVVRNRTGKHDSAHGHMRSSLHIRSSRGGSRAAVSACRVNSAARVR